MEMVDLMAVEALQIALQSIVPFERKRNREELKKLEF